MHKDRVLATELFDKITDAATAASYIKENMKVGFSGFTSAGYAKLVPTAIANQGTAKNLTIITGASTGAELDGELAKAGLMGRRYPFQSNNYSRDNINNGTTEYSDLHLSQVPRMLRQGIWGRLDYTIIECCMITEECGLVPSLAVGCTNALVEQADKIIVEINLNMPTSIYGLHDILSGDSREPINICSPSDRVGLPYIPCSPDKIVAIVFNDTIGETPVFKEPDDVSNQIAQNIITFLKSEIAAGRMPENLYPLQSGVGAVANAALAVLNSAGFSNMTMFTEVAQDSALDLLYEGVVTELSAAALSLSEEGIYKLFDHFDSVKDKITLRPQEISNHPEMLRRIRPVAMNTAIEIDLYGNVNSTHIMGTKMMNGIGGSGDFARNAWVTIFMTPSVAKNGAISSIVPMVSHVDNSEHDVHVVVTEQGYADLRGKSPKERARLIIENCAHPDYKAELWEYYNRALEVSPAKHTPHDLTQAFDMHLRYLETGSMHK